MVALTGYLQKSTPLYFSKDGGSIPAFYNKVVALAVYLLYSVLYSLMF
jgi:hypothetical protein